MFSKDHLSKILAIFILVTATLGSSPQPAQAITAEEFLRLLGIWGRYADDLNKNFGSGYRPPTQQPIPPTIPQNPSPDNTSPQPFSHPDFFKN